VAHHILGPSGNSWWTKCLAAPRFIEKLGLKDVESEWAQEGDRLHGIAADAFLTGAPADAFDLSKKEARLMQAGLDWLDDQGFEQWGVEQTLDLSAVYPGRFGTCDVWGLRGRQLTIFDWKWGAGIVVTPEENLQLQDYAGGVIDTLGGTLANDDLEVRLVIYQPLRSEEIEAWTTDVPNLAVTRGWLAARAKIAMEDPAAPFNPGPEQCRLCPAAQDDLCAARTLYMRSLTVPRIPVEDMQPDFREKVWRESASIKKWLGQVEGRLLADAQAGAAGPRVKAVLGDYGRREWADDAQALAALTEWLGRDAAVTVTVKSPTQVEDEIPPSRKDEFQRLITRKDPKPILVDASDKRPPILPYVDLLEDLE
jgi:hypothetical protein